MRRSISFLALVAALLIPPAVQAQPPSMRGERPFGVRADRPNGPGLEREFSFENRELTVVLDGVEVAPKVLAEANKPLTYLIDRYSIAEDAVYVFSSDWAFAEYLRQAHGDRLTQSPTPTGPEPVIMELVGPCSTCGGGGGGGSEPDPHDQCSQGFAWFYEHVDYEGSSTSIGEGEEVDFVDDGWDDWWSDEISSVESAGSYTVLYEHKDFGGDDLWIEGCIDVRSLHSANNALGYDPHFGDKTTSVRIIE